MVDRQRIDSGVRFRLAKWLRRPTVTVDGDWGAFRGDADDAVMLRHYGRHGTWSAGSVALLVAEAARLAEAGEPDPILLDVGAAIGLISLGYLRQADGNALAIESHPATFQHLQHNLQHSVVSGRVQAHQLAVGIPDQHSGDVVMQRAVGNGGDSWVVGEVASGEGTPLIRLDDLAAPYFDRPLLLKVDVQGYEPNVLRGGLETLQRAELAIIEFWPFGLRRMGHDPEQFADQLLAGVERVALLVQEHEIAPLEWLTLSEARQRLAEVIADGSAGRQVDVVLGANRG